MTNLFIPLFSLYCLLYCFPVAAYMANKAVCLHALDLYTLKCCDK